MTSSRGAWVVAALALFVALDGPAQAKNAIGSATSHINGKRIARASIAGNRLRKATISGSRIRKNTLTGREIDERRLGPVPGAERATVARSAQEALSAQTADRADVADTLAGQATAFRRATVTDGPTEGAARGAAPAVALYDDDHFGYYGKCFRDTSVTPGRVFAEVYIAAKQDGSITDSTDGAEFSGQTAADFLNTNTAEIDRYVISVNGTEQRDYESNHGHSSSVAPDGFAHLAEFSAGYKQGTAQAPDGAYGPGDGCLFVGRVQVLK